MARVHRVLVADDQPELREFLTRVVETRLGAEAVVARDGGEALSWLEDEGYSFDLLLLDVDMPRASGFDVLRAMGAIRPEVPVVLMSGNHDHQRVALDLGACAFLSKPFGLAELSETLDVALSAPLAVAS